MSAREARNALLRTLQDERIGGRKRQHIEDVADRMVAEAVAEYRKALVARVREAMAEEPRMYTEIFLDLIEQDQPKGGPG